MEAAEQLSLLPVPVCACSSPVGKWRSSRSSRSLWSWRAYSSPLGSGGHREIPLLPVSACLLLTAGKWRPLRSSYSSRPRHARSSPADGSSSCALVWRTTCVAVAEDHSVRRRAAGRPPCPILEPVGAHGQADAGKQPRHDGGGGR